MRILPPATAVVAAVLVLALTGCASPGSGSGSTSAIAVAANTVDSTLVQTKASVQLLRNEAASRLPKIVFKEVLGTVDESTSCLDTKQDPDGLARAWRSTTTIMVVNSQAARIQTVTDAMAATFVDQGWTADAATPSEATVTTLTKPDALATIELSVQPKAQGEKPAIHIEVHGPCVMTGGAHSDEVTVLEQRDATPAP